MSYNLNQLSFFGIETWQLIRIFHRMKSVLLLDTVVADKRQSKVPDDVNCSVDQMVSSTFSLTAFDSTFSGKVSRRVCSEEVFLASEQVHCAPRRGSLSKVHLTLDAAIVRPVDPQRECSTSLGWMSQFLN